MSKIAQRLITAAILAIFCFGVGAASLGAFGDGPRTLLANVWVLIAGFASVYYDFFERLGMVLAPLVAVGSGGYAIYQKWHFAGHNLHLRLAEYLSREERRLRGADRELDCHADRPGPARPFQSPIFSNTAIGSALRKMRWGTPSMRTLHWGRIRRAEQEVDEASKELENQLRLWELAKKKYQRRLIQAYLVKGAILAARAEELTQ